VNISRFCICSLNVSTKTFTIICISGIPSSTQQQLVVELISPYVCKRPEWHGEKITEATVLCAGHVPGGKGACVGDSGGPLQCQSHDGRWKLLGITSWNSGCAVHKKPTVFTRVASLLDWIRKYTNGMYAAHFYILPANAEILIIQTSFDFCFTSIFL